MNKYQEEFDLVRRLCSLNGRELTILNYGIEEGKNKAIDEFVDKAYDVLGSEDRDIYARESIKEIAEMIKGE